MTTTADEQRLRDRIARIDERISGLQAQKRDLEREIGRKYRRLAARDPDAFNAAWERNEVPKEALR